MWTYNMTYQLMIEFKTLIPLVRMTYIIETNLYQFQPMEYTYDWVHDI